MSLTKCVVRVAIGCVLAMRSAPASAAEPLTPTEQARYADLDARELQTFTNVDLADYLALRHKDLAAKGESPDPANEVAHYAVKALGQPYRLYASRFDYAESDCVVFVERCLAMGLSADWTTYRKLCDRLRHREGVVGYATRNFFTLGDWVPSNAFLLKDISRELGSCQGPIAVGFTHVLRPKVFRDVPPDPVSGVATEFVGADYASPNKVARTEFYVPRGRLPNVLPELHTGDVALVIRRWDAPGKAPWFDCDHMGILIRGAGDTVAIAHSAPRCARLERLEAFLAQFSDVSGFKILRLVPQSREVVRYELEQRQANLTAPSATTEDSLVEAVRRARTTPASAGSHAASAPTRPVIERSIPAVPPASRPGPTADRIGNLPGIWREEATSAGVAETYRRLYTAEISKVFARHQRLIFPATADEAYRSSLRGFLREHAPYLRAADNPRGKGVVFWLVWCTLQACDGPPPSDAELERFRREYLHLFDEVLARAQSRLLPGPFATLPAEASRSIRDAMTLRAKVFENRVRKLQADFLYPALKGPINDAVRRAVLQCYENPGYYPMNHELRPPFVSAEEAYVTRAVRIIEQLDDLVLFDLLVEAVRPHVLRPKWWSSELPALDGRPGAWPAVVTLNVSEKPTTREAPE